MKGPLKKIVAQEVRMKHSASRIGTGGGWRVTLECGHFRDLNNSEYPKSGALNCKDCLRLNHVPLNLEARLKSLK